MIKKMTILTFFAAALVSCGSSYTEDQAKAATQFCECMEAETVGDFDIDYFECDNAVKADFEGDVFADEGYLGALEEKCPDITAKIQ
jgi:hypothetical protein